MVAGPSGALPSLKVSLLDPCFWGTSMPRVQGSGNADSYCQLVSMLCFLREVIASKEWSMSNHADTLFSLEKPFLPAFDKSLRHKNVRRST